MLAAKLIHNASDSVEPDQSTNNTASTPKPPKTSLKQQKFVEGFLQHANASRAARDAGYSPSSAHVTASRILRRQDVQSQIKSRIEEAQIDTDEIIGTLVSHMRADLGALLADDGSLDLAGAIENRSTHIIKKIKITRRPVRNNGASKEESATEPAEEITYEIVLHDAQAAARQLARIFSLRDEKNRSQRHEPISDSLQDVPISPHTILAALELDRSCNAPRRKEP
jgi:hypothetical protein